jgi:CRP/FNR family transcriptional regulator, cyclic AMP receptor protein
VDPDALRKIDILEGLNEAQHSRLAAIARVQSFRAGEYVFLLGDSADRIYGVLAGKVDLCFPLSLGGGVEEVCVESAFPGRTIGWSALVKPYRFTLSAKATVPCEFVAFTRHDLHRLFETDSFSGYLLMRRIAEVVGERFLGMQALWLRSLQRDLSNRFSEHAVATEFEEDCHVRTR